MTTPTLEFRTLLTNLQQTCTADKPYDELSNEEIEKLVARKHHVGDGLWTATTVQQLCCYHTNVLNVLLTTVKQPHIR